MVVTSNTLLDIHIRNLGLKVADLTICSLASTIAINFYFMLRGTSLVMVFSQFLVMSLLAATLPESTLVVNLYDGGLAVLKAGKRLSAIKFRPSSS